MQKSYAEKIPRGLVVSCQLDRKEPMHSPQHCALFAEAASMGGAVAVRVDGLENIKEVRSTVRLPLIGCIRSRYADDLPLSTHGIDEAEQLLRAGVDVIAVDGTARARPATTYDGIGTIAEIRRRLPQGTILADVSTFEEGIRALDRGADALSTVLFGRTPETFDDGGDPVRQLALIEKLSHATDQPIVAEGFVFTPEEATEALDAGAYGVIVGAAITRPRIITRLFGDAIARSLA